MIADARQRLAYKRMQARQLIDWRHARGWSQARLAAELGISPSRLADYEAGHTRGHAARPAPIPRVIALALDALHLIDREPALVAAILAKPNP